MLAVVQGGQSAEAGQVSDHSQKRQKIYSPKRGSTQRKFCQHPSLGELKERRSTSARALRILAQASRSETHQLESQVRWWVTLSKLAGAFRTQVGHHLRSESALEVCVRRPRCARHHLHGAGVRKPSQKRKSPFHSITSSARARSIGGTSRPRAFAAFRLMTNSNLID